MKIRVSVVRIRLQAPLPLSSSGFCQGHLARVGLAAKWPKFRLGNCIPVTRRDATVSCRLNNKYRKYLVQVPDCCRCEGEKKLCALDATWGVRQRDLTAFLLAGRGDRDIVPGPWRRRSFSNGGCRRAAPLVRLDPAVAQFHYRDGRLTRSVSWVPRVRPKQELAKNAR